MKPIERLVAAALRCQDGLEDMLSQYAEEREVSWKKRLHDEARAAIKELGDALVAYQEAGGSAECGGTGCTEIKDDTNMAPMRAPCPYGCPSEKEPFGCGHQQKEEGEE